jgi:hypothetical protein
MHAIAFVAFLACIDVTHQAVNHRKGVEVSPLSDTITYWIYFRTKFIVLFHLLFFKKDSFPVFDDSLASFWS